MYVSHSDKQLTPWLICSGYDTDVLDMVLKTVEDEDATENEISNTSILDDISNFN